MDFHTSGAAGLPSLQRRGEGRSGGGQGRWASACQTGRRRLDAPGEHTTHVAERIAAGMDDGMGRAVLTLLRSAHSP
jgi:hypothetical protein